MPIHDKPAHMICDIPGVPNVSKIYPPKRLKPGPTARVPRDELRDRCITFNDKDVEAIDKFRKAFPMKPTRSAWIVYVIRQHIEANRRRDLPGIVPKR